MSKGRKNITKSLPLCQTQTNPQPPHHFMLQQYLLGQEILNRKKQSKHYQLQPKCTQIPITSFLTFLLKNDNREGRKLFQVIQSFLYLSILLFIQLFLHSAIKNLLSTFYLPDSILGAKNTKINLKNVITAQATLDLPYLKLYMCICLCPIILPAMHILMKLILNIV